MPGVLETGVSPPVLVETLWTSARGAIRHPSLRFRNVHHSHVLSPCFAPPLPSFPPSLPLFPLHLPSFLPSPGHSRESGIHGGGRSAPQSRTDLQDHVC